MAAFNPYSLYSMSVAQSVSDNENIKKQELVRVINAFYNFHKPETYEERQKFINDTLQGKNYNQTIKYKEETMDFEFTEDFVRVTLHSPEESRNGSYFQCSLTKD